MVPTRSPAPDRTERAMATTLPLPFVPPTSAPRSERSGCPDLGHQARHALEAQADPESSALGERGDRLAVR